MRFPRGLLLSIIAASFVAARPGTMEFGRAQTTSPPAARSAVPAHAPQGPSSAAMAGKTAGEYYKNIQVMKDVPADQIIPSMQFISASLGVECEHCHVGREFEKDDKQPKKTARDMMKMMFTINKDNFKGRQEVTCFTCHHAAGDPVSIPLVAESDMPPGPGGPHPGEPNAAAAPALPGADEIISKYVQAVGGAEAIEKISSRVEKGTISFGGQQSEVEVFAKAPDKRLTVMHTPRGESVTAYDGHIGWLGGVGPPREMTAQETEAFRLDADMHFPIDAPKIFQSVRVRPPEKIGDREAILLLGLREGQPSVRLYFDTESGLLVREVRYAQTPLGRMPTQIDYADYRDADGEKIPFRWTLSRPNGRFTIQINSVQQNVTIDDMKFSQPAAH